MLLRGEERGMIVFEGYYSIRRQLKALLGIEAEDKN